MGRRVARVRVGRPLVFEGPYRRRWRAFMAELTGRRMVSVTRRAKRLILTAEKGLALVVQLGMTGKFLLPNSQERGRGGCTEAYAARLVLPRRDGGSLCGPAPVRAYLVSARPGPGGAGRRDGSSRLDAFGARGVGHGPQDLRRPAPDGPARQSAIAGSRRIAGLGNIYADESLWAARIHPARAGSSLTAAEAAALLREIKIVLRRAIRAGGTTFSDFRNVHGEMGRFRDRLRVYGRQGEPCPRCGTTIQYLCVAGRGTHICPHCQA